MASGPTVVISGRAAARLRAGHLWVYHSDLLSQDSLPPGALVTVVDERGARLGTAFYSSTSQIALRMLSPGPVGGTAGVVELLGKRIHAAIEYRQRLVTGTDAYRVIFSEADGLPGLIVDRYNDILALQVLTQAMDLPEIRGAVLSSLVAEISPVSVVERTEPRIRELEQLPASPAGPLHGDKLETVYTMNGLKFLFQAQSGQKTGAFLDQRENYAAAVQCARGEALDVFCYQGGFALHLARVCGRVTGVDSSRPALEAAEQNAALNGLEIEWMEANAFDLLKDFAAAGTKYDTIVLDPPAFARSKRNLETALRGYKELNLRALKMLRSGGTLVSCSCSYHVSDSDFMAMLAAAAADARRHVRIVEKRGQAKDHPILLSVPETGYLKCAIGIVS